MSSSPRPRTEQRSAAGTAVLRAPAVIRRSDGAVPARSLPVAAVIAAAWPALLGAVLVGLPVLVTWVVTPHADTATDEPVRAMGLAWLIAHQAPVTMAGQTVRLLPLGLVAIPAVLLYRSGRWASQSASVADVGDAVLLTVSTSIMYALTTGLVAVVATPGSATVAPFAAVLAGLTVALPALAIGVARGSVGAARVSARIPWEVRAVGRAVLAVLLVLIAAAALLIALLLTLHWPAVTDTTAELTARGLGGLALLLLSLAYLPTAVLWALAVLLGPGVSLGAGAHLSALGVDPAVLPGLPLLAAIPGRVPGWAPVLLIVPIVAGVLGGRVLARAGLSHAGPVVGPGAERGSRLRRLSLVAAVPAGVGAAVAVLCAAASGDLGERQLQGLGPAWAAGGLAAFGAVTVGIVVAALLPPHEHSDRPA